MPFEQFDRKRLRLRPLAERVHDMDRSRLVFPDDPREPFEHEALPRAARVQLPASVTTTGCGNKAARTDLTHADLDALGGVDSIMREITRRISFGMGVSAQERVDHPVLEKIRTAIHDFELAMIGQTTESVARYVRSGEFGLWNETGRINQAAIDAHRAGIGLGEAIGRMIEEESFPYRETSVLAAGVRLGIPVTIHVAIGQDILHEHPNFDPAATGATFDRGEVPDAPDPTTPPRSVPHIRDQGNATPG